MGEPSVMSDTSILPWLRHATRLSNPHAAAEVIAAKDLNNLYISSSFFVDPERYRITPSCG
jgi:hypothetical protein